MRLDRAPERARRCPHREISRNCSKRSASKLDGKANVLKAAPPSWRPDISGPADLVEEVVRLAGVDQRAGDANAAPAGVARPVLTRAAGARAKRAPALLAARGLVEAVTWSFIPRGEASAVRRRGA